MIITAILKKRYSIDNERDLTSAILFKIMIKLLFKYNLN